MLHTMLTILLWLLIQCFLRALSFDRYRMLILKAALEYGSSDEGVGCYASNCMGQTGAGLQKLFLVNLKKVSG